MPNYVDVHSHLNFPDYDLDREAVIARMKEKGVWTITVGTDYETSKSAAELAASNDGFFASIGMHPTHDFEASEASGNLSTLMLLPKIVAVGECGLDYFRLAAGDSAAKKRQRDNFQMQIDLAIKYEKPLMIHCRDAYEDVHDMLFSAKRQAGDRLRANIHFFVGDMTVAKKFLELDFSFSFGGVLTFTSQYHEVLRFIPLAHIMSETDAPYVAPVPHRGRRNEPVFIEEVVNAIADIRGEDREMVRATLVSNAVRFFGLK